MRSPLSQCLDTRKSHQTEDHGVYEIHYDFGVIYIDWNWSENIQIKGMWLCSLDLWFIWYPYWLINHTKLKLINWSSLEIPLTYLCVTLCNYQNTFMHKSELKTHSTLINHVIKGYELRVGTTRTHRSTDSLTIKFLNWLSILL